MKNFLGKKFSLLRVVFLFGLVGSVFMGCIGNMSSGNEKDKEEEKKEETTEKAFDAIISFGEWLYKAGSQPQIKYYIEKETGKGDITFEAVMTMYNNDELIGINSFKTTLQENLNVDYFVISPDKNKAVTKIELKDIYLDGRKYSVTKTFFIKAE